MSRIGDRTFYIPSQMFLLEVSLAKSVAACSQLLSLLRKGFEITAGKVLKSQRKPKSMKSVYGKAKKEIQKSKTYKCGEDTHKI